MVSLGTLHDRITLSPLRDAWRSPTRRGSSNSGGNGTPGFAQEIRKTVAIKGRNARARSRAGFIENVRAYHGHTRSTDQLFDGFAEHARMMIDIFFAGHRRH